MKLNKITGFSGRLMLGVILGIGLVSSLEGYNAKLINEKNRQNKVKKNREYIQKLNKNLENIVYTKGKYENNNINILDVNKYYYTNIYDLEKANIKKVGNANSQKAILTGDKNEFVKNSYQTVTTLNILDQDLSGLASEFYDENSVRLNEKVKSFENLKKQLKRMHEEVQSKKDFKWPCVLVSYYKDAWGRDFEYIRDDDSKAKIGFTLPWDSSERVFLDLNLPEMPKGIISSDIKKIVMNYYFYYILTQDGRVYVDGIFNSKGYIGGESLESKGFLSLTDVDNIWTDPNNSSVVLQRKNGDILVTGKNRGGSLGLGHTNFVDTWTTPPWQSKIGMIKEAYVNSDNFFVITENGDVYSAGYNGGRLGVGNTDTTISLTKSWDGRIEKAVAIYSDRSSYLLTDKGNLYATGYNYNGQLGIGNTTNVDDWEKSWDVSLGHIKNFSMGNFSAFIKTDKDEIYVVGDNSSGQLGVENAAKISNWNKIWDISKGKIKKYKYQDPNVEDFLSESALFYVLTESGDLYVTGKNSYGELGLGHKNNISKLTKTWDSSRGNILDFGISYNKDKHSYILTDVGELYMTGKSLNVLTEGAYSELANWTKVKDNVKSFFYNPYNDSIIMNNNDLLFYAYWNDQVYLINNVRSCLFYGCQFYQLTNGDVFWFSNRENAQFHSSEQLPWVERIPETAEFDRGFTVLSNDSVFFMLFHDSPSKGVVKLPVEIEDGNACN